MNFATKVWTADEWAQRTAEHVAGLLPDKGAVVITGGTTAADVYPLLADTGAVWSDLHVFFSDERCVPPDDDKSNFRMATESLLARVRPAEVHRMRGEDDPGTAAAAYDREVRTAAGDGFGLVLLGMGADCHVAGLYPGSPALEEDALRCAAVNRPDGMGGLTLTPPALLSSARVILIARGDGKSEAVGRVVRGDDPPAECPVRLFADHPDVTLLLDEGAAAAL